MVKEKEKPSIYTDRSAIGSAGELDEYGVWVKSEPQDLSAAGADLDGFPLSLDGDFGSFDSGPDALSGDPGDVSGEEMPVFDLSEDTAGDESLAAEDAPLPAGEEQFPGIDDPGSFFTEGGLGEDAAGMSADIFSDTSDDTAGAAQTGGEASSADASTQLLMKIAEELASIRTELSTLKEELAAIRGEPRAEEKTDGQRGGFFNEEADEKIALTGDELDNILNTAAFTEEAGVDAAQENISPETEEPFPREEPFDAAPPQADASDESPEEEEEIEIDLDDLGIDLDSIDTQAEESAEAAGGDPVYDALDLSLDVSGVLENQDEAALTAAAPDDGADSFDGEIPAYDEKSEKAEAAPETEPSGSDLKYLEDTELTASASDSAPADSFDESSLPEIDLDDAIFNDTPLEDSISEEIPAMDISVEESAISEDAVEPPKTDEVSFDTAAFDLSDAVIDEPDLSAEITETSLEEPSLETFSLDEIEDVSLDIDDLDRLETEPVSVEAELPVPEESAEIEEQNAAAGEDFDQVIPDGFVVENTDAPVLEDELDISLDEDELAAPETASGEDFPELEVKLPEAEAASQSAQSAQSGGESLTIPSTFKNELKTVLSYMDHLLESLPEDKIEEFANSEYFDTYKKLFKELGLV